MGGSKFGKKDREEIIADFELEQQNNYRRIFLGDKESKQTKEFQRGKVKVSPTYGVRVQKPLKKEIKNEEDFFDAIEEVKNFQSNPTEITKPEENQEPITNNIFLPSINIERVQDSSHSSKKVMKRTNIKK